MNNLDLNTLGIYARKREMYLRKCKPEMYKELAREGMLLEHLMDIQETAQGYVERIVAQMAAREGTDEVLKEHDPERWVGLMNHYKHCAEEFVWQEVVHA